MENRENFINLQVPVEGTCFFLLFMAILYYLCYTTGNAYIKKGGLAMTKKIYSIDDIKKILNEILNNTDVETAILFGSYAKNTPTQTSDIDILIDSKGKIKGLKFFAIIDMIREKFDKDVDVIEKSEIDKNSKIEKEIKRTGVVVYEK